MKKTILACAILSIAYGCSKDEDDYEITPEGLLGDWELVNATGEVHNTWIDSTANYDLTSCDDILNLRFKDDGFLVYELPESLENPCFMYIKYLKYQIVDKEVVFHDPLDSPMDGYYIKQKSANRITFGYEIIENGQVTLKNTYILEKL